MGGNNRKIQQQKGDLVWLSAEYISRPVHRPRSGAPPGPAIKHTPNNAGWSHLPCFPPPTEHTRLRVDSQRTDTPSIIIINNKKDAQASAGFSSFLCGTSFPQIPACSSLNRGENTELAAALCKETQYGRRLHRDHLPACVRLGGVKTLSLPCSTEL